MKISCVISHLSFLLIFSSIISAGPLGVYPSVSRAGGFGDVLQGYNRLSYKDYPYDVHCFDTTGIRLIYDDCWHNPKTTDIIIRNRDELSRINGRGFAVSDSFGGNELIDEYSDVYDSGSLVSPLGFGINCFDTTGIRIIYDDCWTSPKTRNLLVTGKVSDTRINTRQFGAASTYYRGTSVVSVLEEVEDCHCVTEDRYYGDSRGILYVKMRPEYQYTSEVRTRLLSLNWADLEGCDPYDVVVVPYLPYIRRGRGYPY